MIFLAQLVVKAINLLRSAKNHGKPSFEKPSTKIDRSHGKVLSKGRQNTLVNSYMPGLISAPKLENASGMETNLVRAAC